MRAQSGVTMSGNVITGNTGYVRGGGIYAGLSPFTSDGDSVYGNDVTVTGGGIYAEHSALAMTRGHVRGNTASSIGGGIYSRAAQFDISNTVVAQNAAGTLGGGVYADSVWGDWENNTVDRNTASISGANAFLSAAAATDVRNNIFSYGNVNGFHAATDLNITYQYNNAFGSTGSDVVTIVPDATNVSRDPAYADTAVARLSPGAPFGERRYGRSGDARTLTARGPTRARSEVRTRCSRRPAT